MSGKQIIKGGSGNFQAERDINIHCFEITKGLAAVDKPVRDIGTEDEPLSINVDDKNTVLIGKLRDGGFNINFIKHAALMKLDSLKIIISYSKTENGKRILNDIYGTLLSIINLKYISQLNEGESLRTDISSFLEDFTHIAKKYADQITIDEAFLEGLLYIATSRCALRWKMEESDEDIYGS